MDHLSGFQKSSDCDVCKQEPRRVPSSADDGRKLKSCFSRGHAPREKHFSGHKCASKVSARSGLYPFSEMLAFQRARVEFLDTRKRTAAKSSGSFKSFAVNQPMMAPIRLKATITPQNTMETVEHSLIRMFREGPEVSLKGSPTVSPTTAALWQSEPLPP